MAAVGVILQLRKLSGRLKSRFYLALTLVLTASIALRLPRFQHNPTYAELKAGATWLASQPMPVVLGGYWGTYVFAALALPARVIPIPVEEDYQRTPWTIDAIHRAETVVISAYRNNRFGPADKPDRWVADRNEFFECTDAAGWSKGSVTFWVYVNATKQSVPISSVLDWDACGEKSLSIAVGGIQSGELVYWTRPPRPNLEVVGEGEQGRTRVPDALEHGTRMTGYLFNKGAPITRITLQPIEHRKGCLLEAIAVFKR